MNDNAKALLLGLFVVGAIGIVKFDACARGSGTSLAPDVPASPGWADSVAKAAGHTPLSPSPAPLPAVPRAAAVPSASRLWYQGGSLHDAGALDWQQADRANKLATAADLIATLWSKQRLKARISARIRDVDDVLPLAEELVVALDKAFAREADPKLNARLYTNQKVSEFALLSMSMMGWI